jgi:hypothetical protein
VPTSHNQERSGASDFDFSERYAKQNSADTDGCRDAPDLAYEKDCIDHDSHPLSNLIHRCDAVN